MPTLCMWQPHLPFIFPEKFLDLYPAEIIHDAPNPYPPKNMPKVAWSSYGELRAYHDIALLNASGAPGTVLPLDVVKDLRRAYYAATSYTDDNIGRVLAALKATGKEEDTIIALWGDYVSGWGARERHIPSFSHAGCV